MADVVRVDAVGGVVSSALVVLLGLRTPVILGECVLAAPIVLFLPKLLVCFLLMLLLLVLHLVTLSVLGVDLGGVLRAVVVVVVLWGDVVCLSVVDRSVRLVVVLKLLLLFVLMRVSLFFGHV